MQRDIQRVKRLAPGLLIVVALAAGLGLAWWSAGVLIGPQQSWAAVAASPATFGLSPRTVAFPAADGLQLKGWWERSGTLLHSKGTVILAHGTHMNKTGMGFAGGRLLARGYNVLIPDLRGHGESAGHYSTCGSMEALDVLGAIAWVRGQREHGPVALLGYSSGAVAALYAAARAPELAAVAADSAYDDVSELLRREAAYEGRATPLMAVAALHRLRLRLFMAPWLGGLSQRLYRVRSGVPLESPDRNLLAAVAKIARPSVLYLRADYDPLVPQEVTARLFARTAAADKRLAVLPGAVHSAMVADPLRYIDTLASFLDQASSAASPLPAGNR